MDDLLNIESFEVGNDTKDFGKFMITIKNRQNNTWQGVIEWIETGKKEYFRSALEMLSLINDAVK